jgi:transcriptional regulator with XRE-family HTH domain
MAKATRGSQLVQQHIDAGNRQLDLAKKVSEKIGRPVHQSTVSGWATGRHMPQGEAMLALQQIAGIPLESWLEPPVEDPIPFDSAPARRGSPSVLPAEHVSEHPSNSA